MIRTFEEISLWTLVTGPDPPPPPEQDEDVPVEGDKDVGTPAVPVSDTASVRSRGKSPSF